jgi:DNA-binding MarR family transcriptional regulator
VLTICNLEETTMAPTTTPVRPSTARATTQVLPASAPGSAAQGVPMTRRERDRLTSDLRMACMRISRRVRFESTAAVAPHQFSVLARLEEAPRTPKELAAFEKVSAPSMTRTVAGLVEGGLVARADDPADGRQEILSLTPVGRRTIRDIRRRRDQWFAARHERLSDVERAVLAQATALLERVAAE